MNALSRGIYNLLKLVCINKIILSSFSFSRFFSLSSSSFYSISDSLLSLSLSFVSSLIFLTHTVVFFFFLDNLTWWVLLMKVVVGFMGMVDGGGGGFCGYC